MLGIGENVKAEAQPDCLGSWADSIVHCELGTRHTNRTWMELVVMASSPREKWGSGLVDKC